jgi:hypothetical protein
MNATRRALNAIRLGQAVQTATLSTMGIMYVISYYYSEARPRAGVTYPLGWWGWFDQGEYIKSVRAFATLNFSPSEFLYPPLYNLIAAPFYYLTSDHPHFIPNLIFLLISVFTVLHVTKRFYGIYLPAAVTVCLFSLLSLVTITQWVIPWTTSLQAALISGLILAFSYFEAKLACFQIQSHTDKRVFFTFFALFSALFPTRPLDAVVWFPFALYFFCRVLLATTKAAPRPLRLRQFLLCCALALLGGLTFVSFYIGFNLFVSSSLLGAYFDIASRNPYIVADIFEKAYSLLIDSGTLYGEYQQAFFEQLPLAAFVAAISLVAIVYTSDLRRWILITAFLHFTVYFPYGDLLPTGLFRYFNFHYFKWSYPWLAVIAAGQVLVWIRDFRTARGWRPLLASIVTLAIGSLISVTPTDSERIDYYRVADANKIAHRVQLRRHADFVDLFGIEGDFRSIYFGNHKLILDNTPVREGYFRLFPVNEGVRLMFLRPQEFSELEFVLDPSVRLSSTEGVGIVSSYRFTLGCRFRECSDPPLIQWQDNSIHIDFHKGSLNQGLNMSSWWSPEPWGRWSRADAAILELRVQPRATIAVSATVMPLLAEKRPRQTISLRVNGCLITKADFSLGKGAPPALKGQIPSHCLREDGHLKVEFRTDAVRSPAALKIGRDVRKLGLGVISIVLTSHDPPP